MLENLDRIRQAIEIETKHRYIDIRGREQTFSNFIKSEIKKEVKKNKNNPRWEVLLEAFDVYPYVSVPERRRSISHLIKVIKSELQKKSSEQVEEKERDAQRKKHPSEVDVMYIKGVGPKVAYKLTN